MDLKWICSRGLYLSGGSVFGIASQAIQQVHYTDFEIGISIVGAFFLVISAAIIEDKGGSK